MKKIILFLSLLTFLILFCACTSENTSQENTAEITEILLSDEKITADGKELDRNRSKALYVENDIVYYEAGKDFTYGEGSEKDAHEKEEADAHTVLHITHPGTYRLKGKLSLGQIAVDLGNDAEDDESAVVTLILDGVDLTCTVAPAVIFYNTYECGNSDAEKASKDVDTSKAGANVILADGSVNTVNGSYVERIYKPDSVVLNESKTEVEDAKKLHKYDGAFYSKTSMNIGGEEKCNGILNINAKNEGLGSELHLTINGGVINILSGNDGINTNEDGVSVTTINGGKLSIKVTGETGEGDGIDSNGWLIINGGEVYAQACATSGDAGIDSDMGIEINGGTVVASGSMLDRIEDGGQTYAVFNFAQKQKGGEKIRLKNENGNIVFEAKPDNAYSILIISTPKLSPGTYTLWSDGTQLEGQSGGMMGGMGTPPAGEAPQTPNGSTPPEMPEGETPPQKPEGDAQHEDRIPSDKVERPDGQRPMPGFEFPNGGEFPDFDFPENQTPDGSFPDRGFHGKRDETVASGEASSDFVIKQGGNTFTAIKALTAKAESNPDQSLAG